MSEFAFNDVFKGQQKRLVRATFRKAYINAVHASSNTVDVYFAENPQNILRNIPVSSAVTIANVKAGQRCRIDLFDETNPLDSVIAYIY